MKTVDEGQSLRHQACMECGAMAQTNQAHLMPKTQVQGQDIFS